jgi:hypothetical protein
MFQMTISGVIQLLAEMTHRGLMILSVKPQAAFTATAPSNPQPPPYFVAHQHFQLNDGLCKLTVLPWLLESPLRALRSPWLCFSHAHERFP